MKKAKITLPTGGTLELNVGVSASTKLLGMRACSAVRQSNLGCLEAIPMDTALGIIEIRGLQAQKRMRVEYSVFGNKSRQSDQQYSAIYQITEEDLVSITESAFEPIEQLQEKMIQSGEPLLCIDRQTFENAVRLIETRERAQFLKKYWLEIVNGRQLLEQAEQGFETICAELKLPRRTSALIKAKANTVIVEEQPTNQSETN